MKRTMAVILAGGEGERLSILSQERAKPAVPFGGKYRIIDFTLSNCVNSDIDDVVVLTQYNPRSLNDHIGLGRPWDLDRNHGGIKLLQPYIARGRVASAPGADLREMVDRDIGRFAPAQRLARSFAQAADADRLVQPKPTLQFGNACLLRQKPRDEVVFRKLAEGGVIHRLLGIGNLPQCRLECGPLSPTTHAYRPLVHADWAGNPDTGTWAVTKEERKLFFAWLSTYPRTIRRMA